MGKYIKPALKWLQATGVGALTAAILYFSDALQTVEGDPGTLEALVLGFVVMLGTKAAGWLVGKLPAPPVE